MFNMLTKRKFTTRQTAVVGMLFAVTLVLGGTGIGFIPIPICKLTIMHIPVIIGSILEGPIVGGLLGLFFGLSSMFQAFNAPLPTSFIFLDPRVAIIPRIFIGITPYLAYKYLKFKNEKLRIAIASAVGSFTNTLGVVSLMYALYLEKYAAALHISTSAASKALFLLILNGVNSAAVSIIFALPVTLAVRKMKH